MKSVEQPITTQLETVRQAAKRIHKRREYVMKLVNDRLLKAYRIAGTPEQPILGVVPSEVNEALKVAMEYIPPTPRKKGPSRGAGFTGGLHPAVRC